MKRSIINISLLACGIMAFTSCGEDAAMEEVSGNVRQEDVETRNSGTALEAKTYSQESLALSYNGAPLYGKSAEFTVLEAGKAMITLSGEAIDLKAIFEDSEVPPMNTCGVFPGSPVTVLNVELTGTESECTFTGASETDFCTFSYEGSVNKDAMSLNLVDVKLKNTTMADATVSIAGGWGFKPFEYNFYNDLRVVWESEKQVELFEGFGMPISTIVSMALVMPIVGEQTVAELLTGSLNQISFLEDGNIVANYLDTTTGEFVDSPMNIAQYVVAGDKLMLYLNPQAIIVNQMQKGQDGTRSENDMENAMNAIFTAVIPMAVQGIPLSYGKAISGVDFETNAPQYFDYPETMSVYLGTEVLKPLLMAVVPVLADEEIKQAVIEAATSNPDFEGMAQMIEGVINSIGEVVETTSVIEIGINLERRSSTSVPMVRI